MKTKVTFLQKALFFIFILFFIYGVYVCKKNLEIKAFNDDFYNYLLQNTKVKSEGNYAEKKEKKGFFIKNLKYNDENVPILMYHSIGQTKFNPYVVDPKAFKEQMEYLWKNKYNTLSIDDLYDYFLYNKPIPRKSVLITFDDGYEDNYKEAYPILKNYNFKATIFVVTGYIDKGTYYMNSQQLKELQKNNIDIECHTLHHERLADLSYSDELNNLIKSKEYLEKLLGKRVEYLAYPYGSYNLETLKAEKKAGYKMAFTINDGRANKKDGILSLKRVFINRFDCMTSFKIKILDP